MTNFKGGFFVKKFLFASTISLSLLFAGCNYQSNDQTKVGKITDVEDNQREVRKIDAEIESFEFEEGVAKSDLIAQIEILDVLKEIDEPSPKTIFRATLKESLKGTSQAKEIFVMQQGNSDAIINDNPLFKQGESYLLFLMKTKDFDVENSYWILGEETGMYKLLDQSIAVKLALKDDGLKEIEVSDEKTVPLIQNSSELNMNGREMQFLKQDELRALIKNVAAEGI